MSLDDARLAALREKFLVRTRADAARLRSAEDLERDECLALVHRLSGSAGLFGFADIGARAEMVEVAILDGEPHDTALRALLAAIDAQLD